MNTSINAKRVLIYGDSITWGRIPNEFTRFDASIRFTGVLQSELDDDYEIIEEGLRGRMTNGDNPYFPDRDGYQQFPAILSSHLPIDLLIIFLGTNDTNFRANKSADQITQELESYLSLTKEVAQNMNMVSPSQIMFIAPPVISEATSQEKGMFNGAKSKCIELCKLIKSMAEKNDCQYFDANEVVNTCEEDGIHLDAESNIALGKALAKIIAKTQ
jgi:lysophospholipase L1-like esterase